MYQFIERLHTLYGLLQDEQSKEVFKARLALDIDYSILDIEHLMSAGSFKIVGRFQPLKDELKKLNQANKKIILYGTADTGRRMANMLQLEHINFYGFCGRHAERFPDGLFGKPVLNPDELVAHGDEYYVVLAVSHYTYPEISQFLQDCGYPEDHILDWVNIYIGDYEDERQYFEFPELYRQGTAFIDGGCCDCGTSRKFAEWCGGAYSSIIAFEPDPDLYAECCKNVRDDPLSNFQLVNAGLSSQEGTAVFDTRIKGAGGIISSGSDSNKAETHIIGDKIEIRTVALDDIVGDRTVGFIKLDIEGAEFDALHGAKNVIVQDKPLLAICVYHLPGDVLAIMDYLHQLLPEYRFLLRHYTDEARETVLYASVDL